MSSSSLIFLSFLVHRMTSVSCACSHTSSTLLNESSSNSELEEALAPVSCSCQTFGSTNRKVTNRDCFNRQQEADGLCSQGCLGHKQPAIKHTVTIKQQLNQIINTNIILAKVVDKSLTSGEFDCGLFYTVDPAE